jgi:2-polyprenyl-3-methyl-5-hydroxy-6-metoxy-1,4-benzoquinol methylase
MTTVAETITLGQVKPYDADHRIDANYIINACALPPDCEQLKRDLNAAAGRLVRKMQSLDLASAPVSDFTRAYLDGKIVHAQSNFQRNTFVLAWALAPMLRWAPLNELILIDYGGGTGDLSLLAKEVGVGTVIYVDLFADFCHDARHIAASVSLEAEHYVKGDIEALLAFCREKSMAPHGVVSFDVLEHIYDVDDFLRKIAMVSPRRLALSLASGANPLSPIVSHRLMRLQRSRELIGNPTKDLTEDPRDTEQPYLALRRQMAAAAALNLTPGEQDELASRTRGMRVADIQRAVARYVETKQLPPQPRHPTNTCDPYTGNWCEQLLDPRDLARKLTAQGVPSKALAGYYGTGRIGSSVKRSLRLLANIGITAAGPLCLRAAPFYCVAGAREGGAV